MSATELYDYALQGENIRVWQTEGADPIIMEAGDFFAWLDLNCYVAENSFHAYSVALDVTSDGFPIWETWAEWWNDPRVIHKPDEFSSDRGLLGQLLCKYLNAPNTPRYTDCREVEELPDVFKTTEERGRATIIGDPDGPAFIIKVNDNI